MRLSSSVPRVVADSALSASFQTHRPGARSNRSQQLQTGPSDSQGGRAPPVALSRADGFEAAVGKVHVGLGKVLNDERPAAGGLSVGKVVGDAERVGDRHVDPLEIVSGSPFDPSQRCARTDERVPDDVPVARVKRPVDAALLSDADQCPQPTVGTLHNKEVRSGTAELEVRAPDRWAPVSDFVSETIPGHDRPRPSHRPRA